MLKIGLHKLMGGHVATFRPSVWDAQTVVKYPHAFLLFIKCPFVTCEREALVN